MIKLTKTEIAWIIAELNKSAAIDTNAVLSYPSMSNTEKALLSLRAENLKSVSNKLQKTLDNGGKRIAII